MRPVCLCLYLCWCSPDVKFNVMWKFLVKKGWKCSKGDLADFLYLAPGATKKTGVPGVTLFTSDDAVQAHVIDNWELYMADVWPADVPPPTYSHSAVWRQLEQRGVLRVDAATAAAESLPQQQQMMWTWTCGC